MSLVKNLFCFLMLLSLCNLSAQRKGKDYSNILRSNNIYEIDSYLRIAHPDDPKRSVLKPRLVKLLNEYIKTAHPADQRVKDFQEKLALLRRKPSTRRSFGERNENIREKQIAKYREESAKKPSNHGTKTYGNAGVSAPATSAGGASSGYVNPEEAEFEMLMSVNPIEHKNNTVKILNSLFDNDPNSKESIVLIENKSMCNIIMRIEGIGTTKYRLAIPAQSDNTIVVAKGDYLFTSLVCGAQYASQKTVQKAVMVALETQ